MSFIHPCVNANVYGYMHACMRTYIKCHHSYINAFRGGSRNLVHRGRFSAIGVRATCHIIPYLSLCFSSRLNAIIFHLIFTL